jgi:hypothetical protein
MKTLEQVSLLNNQDYVFADPESSRLEKRSAGTIDIPQKFTIVGVYEMPFGKGRKWATRGVSDYVFGGWQLNFDITYQRGWVPDYPNAAQVRPGSAKLSGSQQSLSRWFDTSLWDDPVTGRRVARQEEYTLRNFPSRFGDVRVPGYRNWDASASKYFPITERVRLQFRFEMINAFNHPWFPNVSSVDVANILFAQLDPTQRNLPRNLKLALMLTW